MLTTLYLEFSSLIKSRQHNWENQFYETYKRELISIKYSHPSTKIKQQPVFITVHGFGSSPFEWKEFKHYVENHSNALVSNTYLNHHKSIATFSKGKWQEWAQPIIDEYHKLTTLGFENIYLCACSTGATLLLHLLNTNSLVPTLPIKHIIFVDPLVKTKRKLLYALPYLKYFIKDIPVHSTIEERKHWLPVRPIHALIELLNLLRYTEKILRKGISCKSHIGFSIYQSKNDPLIERQSSLDIYNGLIKKTPLDITIHTIQSDKHVFTRLEGREDVSLSDIKTQYQTFHHIINTIKNKYSRLKYDGYV